MPTQTGHLVLADISGYTAFVAETELEHSREILNELLETLVRGLAEHLRIGQIEGDAIFALGETIPEDPNAWLEGIFIRFHRHLNAIKRVSTCPCRACVSVGSLTLKFICHYGEYLPQSFLGKETFVGNAVNQVHRLLKNKVPSREYLLVTKETLDHFPREMRATFTPHREEYDLGAVECGWLDLAPLRKDPRADEEVKIVDADRAQLSFERVFNAPTERLWALLTDPAVRARWMGPDVRRVDRLPGARRTLVGSEYHCHHGQDELAVFRIMEARRPAQMTAVINVEGMLVWNTTTLEDLPEGRTKLVSRYHFGEGLPEEVLAMGKKGFEDYERYALPTIAREIERGTEAVAPA
ncbi:MAG: hypothetical protein A3H36_09500 [Chloroflexi bacterium RIFCSPLOWO2_02_FULL_71_16]|nr:MAG: hypothetical protein A3H36_09500 [Chloroflexi bacterium RIFCSPLOWO2_02_FULL_71_16]